VRIGKIDPVRVLITTSPGLGHLFPLVPLAWALRSQGHQVLVASTGGAVPAAVAAGLPAVDVAPGANVQQIFLHFARFPARTSDPGAANPVRESAAMFARVSDVTVDGLLDVARAWRPHLVVHSLFQGAGPLVAARLGVPAVQHGIALTGDTTAGELLRRHMADSYRRHGVTGAPPALLTVAVAPPSMRVGDPADRQIRYVPYNAGGELPEWLWTPRERPRVAVTLGTVVPRLSGWDTLRTLLAAAGEVDAEFVLVLGEHGTPSPDLLPGNVRTAGWIPLNALLPVCDAVIHHGGAGTLMAAVCAGVPQLVLPHGADQFRNAQAVQERGVGLVSSPQQADAALVERLLADHTLRRAAEQVRAEVEALPSPADLVPELVALTER